MQVQTNLCALATMAILPLSVAYGQTTGVALPPTIQTPESITSAAKSLSGPGFSALRESVARQSSAIANAASSDPSAYNRQLMRSDVLDRQAKTMAVSNKEAERSVGAEQIKLAQLTLPGIDQFASDLKNGKYIVASSKGGEIVTLIRSLAMRDKKEQIDILKKIQLFSVQGYPEAQNFVGNIFEFGLFGNSKDMQKAAAYYILAAKQRYQPAIFNLALMNYFGRLGAANVPEAERLLYQAYAIGPEASSRVCGMAAYVEYRMSKTGESMMYAKNCKSPLANIPNVVYSSDIPVPDKIKMLKDSIAAGANDGFGLLAQLSKAIPNDSEYLSCKYQIMNRIQFNANPPNLRDTAKNCYFGVVPGANSPDGRARSETAILSISGFVSTELTSLSQLRKTNNFHHHFSVPFLPYTQADVDLFDSIYPKGSQ